MAKPTKFFASIAAATLLGVAGLTGCGGESAPVETTEPSATSTSTTAESTAETTTEAPKPGNDKITEVDQVGEVDLTTLLDRMTKAIEEAGTYVSTTKVDMKIGDQNVQSESVTQFDVRDPQNPKMHQVMKGSVEQEAIIIGRTMYTLMDDGMWQKTEIAGEDATVDPFELLPDGLVANYVGIEQVDGQDTLRYELTVPGQAGSFAYFLDGNDRPVRAEIDVFGNGQPSVATYDYDAEVDIQAPPADKIMA